MRQKITDFLSRNMEKAYYPGCQVLVGRGGETLVDLSLGSKVRGSNRPEDPVTSDTLFNLESITKVMVTLPLTFSLLEEGKLRLDDLLVETLPEFGTTDARKTVTVRDMLNFTAGIPLADPEGSEEAAASGDLDRCWDLHYLQELATPPRTRVFYSDVSCRVFGKMLERILGTDLQQAARERVFAPLGMKDTFFSPADKEHCADTGVSDSGRPLRGEVGQDLEHHMGEVLASDGLFSTARDMAIFSEMLLSGGVYGGKRVFGGVTAERMMEPVTNGDLCERPISYLHYILSGPKVWFWEYAQSPFSFFGDLVSDRAVGKMGGAGTFLLIDPAYDLVVVYLTNYGQPENTLEGDQAWNRHLKEDNPSSCHIRETSARVEALQVGRVVLAGRDVAALEEGTGDEKVRRGPVEGRGHVVEDGQPQQGLDVHVVGMGAQRVDEEDEGLHLPLAESGAHLLVTAEGAAAEACHVQLREPFGDQASRCPRGQNGVLRQPFQVLPNPAQQIFLPFVMGDQSDPFHGRPSPFRTLCNISVKKRSRL